MGRIKIEDLSEDHKISTEEMRKVFGGTYYISHPFFDSSRSMEIKLVDLNMEEIRNKRDEILVEFENFDQKSGIRSLGTVRKTL